MADRTRPIIIGVCPRCAGTGIESYHHENGPITCVRCKGHGDLDAYRLITAYRIGKEDALQEIRVGLGQLARIADAEASSERENIDRIRREVDWDGGQ